MSFFSNKKNFLILMVMIVLLLNMNNFLLARSYRAGPKSTLPANTKIKWSNFLHVGSEFRWTVQSYQNGDSGLDPFICGRPFALNDVFK
ncbi:MAG: hypothetical protein ACTSP4_16165, partial [Candidatus Hodarchaeales archaeon]